jgi:hypothetical protein
MVDSNINAQIVMAVQFASLILSHTTQDADQLATTNTETFVRIALLIYSRLILKP